MGKAEKKDFRSENLVLEATGVTLQRRVTQRVRTRTNKRKTVGTVNKECEWVPALPSLDVAGWQNDPDDSLQRGRCGLVESSGITAVASCTGASSVKTLGTARGL